MNHFFIRRLLQRSFRGALVGSIFGFVVAYCALGFLWLGGFALVKFIDSVATDLGSGQGHYLIYPTLLSGTIGFLIGLISSLFSRAPMRTEQ